MISIVDSAMTKYRGLSTDTKPSAPANGSEYYCMDTGDTYYYDAAGEQWVAPTPASSGS